MSSSYNLLSNTVRAAIATGLQPTREQIRERVSQFRRLPGMEVTDDDAEKLCRAIEASLDITMDLGSIIQEEFVEWLDAEKQNIKPYYWERYRRLLQQKNFPPRVISRLDEVTDRTLGLLERPSKLGPWDRRGMVVGHVQSGKTANYTGLICKAADAGYKLIVIIAGIHNNLRNQTQARIDEGFVGRDSGALLKNNKQNRIIGVGKFDKQELPLTVTNTTRDFNKQTATTLGVELRSLKVPAVLVIKKNASTLKHLIDWLMAHNAQGESNLVDAPMLLIDDEADNASIDISSDPETSSTINRRIRKLLKMFNRSCYVGYTATPFANIFIDPDTQTEMLNTDLFPRDFIVSLDPPSNYFGATQIFSDMALPSILKEIKDNEDWLPIKHKNFHEVAELPPSMLNAVRTFIVARAIRILRQEGPKHCSMLVNASRFTSVQSEIRDHLHDFMANVVRHIRFEKSGDAQKAREDDSVISDLYKTWKEEYSALEFTWEKIFSVLLEAAAPIRVIAVNSKSATPLDYESYEDKGRQVIAVGGFSLSRGLTLEGLTVSYFLRNSIMYDTLMQMGRWFGFRPGYEDLCRVWMTPDAIGWYEHITESIEELRLELRAMEQAKLTPEQFGLKVRSHPDSLIVTARNKMGTAETFKLRIGLANEFIETYAVPGQSVLIKKNSNAARRLIADLGRDKKVMESRKDGNILWRNASADTIIEFLRSWNNNQESLTTATGPVIEYIERQRPVELERWDVVLIGLQRGATKESNELGPMIKCESRTVSDRTTPTSIYLSSKNRVASRGDEKIGLSPDDVKKAEDVWKQESNREGKNPANVPDRVYRAHRSVPLLIIHLLELKAPAREDSKTVTLPDSLVVAWGISFPKSNADDKTVEYIVNTTWMREKFVDDFDEEDMEITDVE